MPEGNARIYFICPVCYWENDTVQEDDPDYGGGANEESLNVARKNYSLFGVSSPRFAHFVRKPHCDELAENNQ